MEHLYEYEDRDLYFHHTRTVHPDPEHSSFRLQLHDRYELYYFLTGEGSFLVEGHAYPLESGMVLILRSGEAHSLHIRPSRPYERMTLLFSPKVLDGIGTPPDLLSPYRDRPLGVGNAFPPGSFASSFVRSCMENMILPEGDPAEKRLSILSNLPPALFELRKAFIGPRSPSPEGAGLVGEIAQFINLHLSEDWDLTTLESHLHRNRDYLNRKFREAMGSSIWEYTIHKRISVAKEKIREGMSPEKAFEASGFQDYSTFYRRYKAITGKSPSEDCRDHARPSGN